MKRNTTVTIGIPAYNEEANIENLLTNLISQKQSNFKLEKIYVLSDGSDDNTNKIVANFSKMNKVIKLIKSEKRNGKIFQLNKLYKLNKSDVLFNFDADIKLKDKYVLSKAVSEFKNNKEISIVAIHQIPIRPKSFIGKCIYAGYEFWDMARLSVPKADHIQNLYGAATAYSKSFIKNFNFPKDITDDRGYLYIKAKEFGKFAYSKKTCIYYLPVSTLHDFRKLADRSFNKNEIALKKYFGDKIDKYYKIPLKNKIFSIIKVFIKEPFYCLAGLTLNIYTRAFPIHDNLYNKKMWEVSKSTKSFKKI